jgi:hypothetical protein
MSYSFKVRQLQPRKNPLDLEVICWNNFAVRSKEDEKLMDIEEKSKEDSSFIR